MKLYSLNGNKNTQVSLKEAILQGQAPDGGLFWPIEIPKLTSGELTEIKSSDFNSIAKIITNKFFEDEIKASVIENLIDQTYDFNAPVKIIDQQHSYLELFHGPTLAFKDFGAKFMATMMNYFAKEQNDKIRILVATSGDTGGAVASAFYGLENIEVIILYPSGGVSPLQELQLTTWGGNISALEVAGSFDDCQALVKACFSENNFSKEHGLTSANSINIGRLIPQSFYYFSAWAQLKREDLTFVVPSGNFGNLTAGALAYRMGLPVKNFIASTNANDIVPSYLKTGNFEPKKSVKTLANAMDVGNPSNFPRLVNLFDSDFKQISSHLTSKSYSDKEILSAIKTINLNDDYLVCPHTATAKLAIDDYSKNDKNTHFVGLATAHPAKFRETVEDAISASIDLPAVLAELKKKTKVSLKIKNNRSDLKDFIQTL